MAVSQADLDETFQNMVNLVEALRAEIHERIKLQERSIEAIEKQNAVISIALGEQAAVLEGMGQTIIPTLEKEDQEEFYRVVKDTRKRMLEALREGASNIEGQDSKLATTLESMADKL